MDVYISIYLYIIHIYISTLYISIDLYIYISVYLYLSIYLSIYLAIVCDHEITHTSYAICREKIYRKLYGPILWMGSNCL